MQKKMISEQIKALVDTEERVKTAADRLNALFQHVEKQLGKHASGAASVRLKDVDSETEPCVTVSFRRKGDQKILAIVSAQDVGDEAEVVPICSAPLRHRVEAARLLPTLIGQLTDQASKRADSTETAVRSLDRLVNG